MGERVFISFLLLCNKLPQAKQFKKNKTFIMAQFPLVRRLGTAWLGPPLRVPWNCCWTLAGLCCIWRLNQGRICFQAYSECGQNSFPLALQLRISASDCWLEAVLRSESFPDTGPSQKAIHTMAVFLSKLSREFLLVKSPKTESQTMLYSQGNDMPSPLPHSVA